MKIKDLLDYASFGCSILEIKNGDYEDIQEYKHKAHDFFDKEVEDIVCIDFITL